MSKTVKTCIFSFVLMAIAAGIFGIMVYQVIAQGDRLIAQIDTLEKERSQEASYYQLQRLSEETKVDRDKLTSYFLEREGDSIDVLNLIEGIAPTVGVTLETKDLDTVMDKKGVGHWIKITFSFSASRDKLLQFIKILETLPYVVRVTSVSMTALSSTEWQADMVMQIRVLNYEE